MAIVELDNSTTSDRVRLHITPFNSELYDRIIPPSLKSSATEISFHKIQTDPERGFGYVELPAKDAEKLKNKLNGTTLKGAKIHIDMARPEKKRKADADGSEVETLPTKKVKKEKRKREQGVIPGHELEEGRSVKRGWSGNEVDGKDKKKTKGDKAKKERKGADGSIEAKKLRFKATLPPNSVPLETKSTSKVREDKPSKEKREKKQIVVQEFDKSRPPPATVSRVTKPAVSFEEGKGWVDEDGNVVEEEHPSQQKRRKLREKAKASLPMPSVGDEKSEPVLDTPAEVAEIAGEDSDAEDEAEEPEDVSMSEADGANGEEPEPAAEDSVEDGSDPSDNGSSGSASEAEAESIVESGVEEVAQVVPPAKEVHPLEALYKKPVPNADDSGKPNLKPINTAFSFFQADDVNDDEEEDAAMVPPQTPHTRQDMEWRGLRSAAPTPDTAAIGKHFSFPSTHDEDNQMDDDEDQADATPRPARLKPEETSKEESEFRKWFYENRGDNNRAWKKSRREAKKQERQRENRRLSRRVV